MSKKAKHPFRGNQHKKVDNPNVRGLNGKTSKLYEGNIMRKAKNIFAVSLLSFAVYGAVPVVPEVYSNTIAQKVVVQEVEKAVLVQDNKIEVLQNKVLQELQHCETGSLAEPDGAIIYDTNGRMSLGAYMWQRESVIYYYSTLYGEEIGKAQAIAIATDHDKATELTRDVLFATDKGWANWINCDKKIDLQTKVNLIKSVM